MLLYESRIYPEWGLRDPALALDLAGDSDPTACLSVW